MTAGPVVGFRVSGLGSALPSRVLTNDDLAARVDTNDAWIRSRTGIQRRHILGEGEDTSTLAVEASRRALEAAGLEAGDLDLVVVATCTPRTPIPSTACWLQEALGCRPIPAFDLGAACSGFVYALVTAAHLMTAGRFRNVLVVGADSMSTVTDYSDRSSCILFGDGGGAVVLTAGGGDGGLYHHLLGTDGAGAETIWVPAGGSRQPASVVSLATGQHTLQMAGRKVFRWAVPKMVDVVRQTLAEADLTLEDLALVVAHQSNRRILEAAAERLGLPWSKMAVNIERVGNTAAASIPMAWSESHRDQPLHDGDWVLLVGLGAGLTWGSALLRW